MRLKDEQLLEVINTAVSCLIDKYSHERGLFRSTVSQTDARSIQTQIANHTFKARDDIDPHILAEVIQSSLKQLQSPLLQDVYSDVLSSELQEEAFEANKAIVQKWMKKVPDNKYAVLNNLFKLLSKLAGLEGNDSGVVQLAYTVSPTICRPTTSAYMSLRHMEDLKKIRPVILFLIENYSEMFSAVRISVKSTISENKTATTIVETTEAENKLSDMMASAMVIDVATKVEESKPVEEQNAFPFVKPNLLVMIPSLQTTEITTPCDVDNVEGEKSSIAPFQPYSDTEWKILHALVNLKVSNFLSFDEKDTSSFIAKEAAGDTYHSVMQAWTARVALAATTTSPVKADLSSVPVSPSSSSIGSRVGNGMMKSAARRSHRRKMVSECKGLRAQITSFEQEFQKRFTRLPKSHERGNMQAVYVKYRDLKREIRDNAATDIQRVIRGYRSRKATRFKIPKKSSANRCSSSSSGAMAKVAANQPQNLFDGPQNELLVKYRELAEQKRDLKKRLKKFDEDFATQHGRAPKKSDKEVIRPMYQKYHEIKNNLDSVRKMIQTSNNPVPDDILDEIMNGTTLGDSKSSTNGSMTDTSDAESDAPVVKVATTTNTRLGVNSNISTTNIGSNTSTATLDDDGDFDSKIISSGNSTMDKTKLQTLEALQIEKKNLHAYLKVYERDFNRTHGRPVMKSEDILPVANEYQRYKELKNLIKEMKQ